MPPDEPPTPGKVRLTPRDCLHQTLFHGSLTLVFASVAFTSLPSSRLIVSLFTLSALVQLFDLVNRVRLYKAVKKGLIVYVDSSVKAASPSAQVSNAVSVPILAVLTFAVAAGTFAVMMICFAGGRGFAWWWLPVWAIPVLLWLFTIRCWQRALEQPTSPVAIADPNPGSTEGFWPPPPTPMKVEKSP